MTTTIEAPEEPQAPEVAEAEEPTRITQVEDLPDPVRADIIARRQAGETLAELKTRFAHVDPAVIREVLPPANKREATQREAKATETTQGVGGRSGKAKSDPKPKATEAPKPEPKSRYVEGKQVADLAESVVAARQLIGRGKLAELLGVTGSAVWRFEAVRDLCRTRADMVQDLTRARNRLGKFLLRHGRVWRGGSTWTHKHQLWLGSQTFDEPALGVTYNHYRAVVATRHAQLDAVEADLAAFIDRPPFAGQVARLAAYRGVTRLGGLTLAAEVCDWRRFARAAQFMGFCGLVPSEYSSGSSVHRGRLTKAGNAHLRAQLIESAWTYRHRPYVGHQIAGRQHGLDPEVIARAWAAQLRLSARFRALAAPKNTKSIVAAAIARELAGFLWAEMTA